MSRKLGKTCNTRHRTIIAKLRQEGASSLSAGEWVKLLKILSKEDFRLWKHSKEFQSCPFDKWTADEWGMALQGMPELMEKCPMRKSISGEDWVDILKLHPTLSDYCDWDRVAMAGWLSLLRAQPSLVSKHNWDWSKIQACDWPMFLQASPECASKMPRNPENLAAAIIAGYGQLIGMEMITGGEWSRIILVRPECFRFCDLEKLSPVDWLAIYQIRVACMHSCLSTDSGDCYCSGHR